MGVIAAATSVPAQAAVNEPPAPPHNIISFPVRDFVSADGYDEGQTVTVEVFRRDPAGVEQLIGTSDPVPPQDDPKTPQFDGIVEVNHPGGGCWIGSTPDILPGDIIRTTVAGSIDSDQTTTANIQAESAEVVSGELVVHGTAQDANGVPLPADQIEQRIVANKDQFDVNQRRTIRANSVGDDGTLSYDAPGSTHWTATYRGLDSDDLKRAQDGQTRILWLGRNPAATTEGTIFEVGEVGGPAAPCTAPLAQTAVLKVDRRFVNAANARIPMVIDGVATNDITNVNVSVGGSTVDVAPSGGTWTATIPAAALASLAEGPFNVTTTFTSSAGTAPPPDSRTLVKDTVAPDMPEGSPAPGAYASAQSVSLFSSDPTATIDYTFGGGTPNTRFSAPLLVTSTQTIRARAMDVAGNSSGVRSLSYTVGALAAEPAQLIPVLPSTQIKGVSVASLAVSRLTLARRISLERLRVDGLRPSMRVQEGTNVVRIAIYKARNGRRTGAALYTTTRAARAGLLRVTLRSRTLLRKLRAGTYVMEIRSGQSLDSLGGARRIAFTVTR